MTANLQQKCVDNILETAITTTISDVEKLDSKKVQIIRREN